MSEWTTDIGQALGQGAQSEVQLFAEALHVGGDCGRCWPTLHGVCTHVDCGTNAQTRAALRHKGNGPIFVKVMRRVYYRRRDVEAWRNDNRWERTDLPASPPPPYRQIGCALSALDFPELLLSVLRFSGNEYVSVCHKTDGGPFCTAVCAPTRALAEVKS